MSLAEDEYQALVEWFCKEFPGEAKIFAGALVAMKRIGWKEAADWLDKNVTPNIPTDSPREDLTQYLQGYRDGRQKAAKALRGEIARQK